MHNGDRLKNRGTSKYKPDELPFGTFKPADTSYLHYSEMVEVQVRQMMCSKKIYHMSGKIACGIINLRMSGVGNQSYGLKLKETL